MFCVDICICNYHLYMGRWPKITIKLLIIDMASLKKRAAASAKQDQTALHIPPKYIYACEQEIKNKG